MKGVPATQLAGLEKFAGQVFEGAQGRYTLDEYAYFDDTSLFSTALFPTTTGLGAAIAAGSSQRLFSIPTGQAGQGFGNALTLAETNLQPGAGNGVFPANQAYVAIAGGFDVYLITNAGAGTGVTTATSQKIPMLASNDIHQVVSNAVWSWQVGGNASPLMQYEPIKLWPTGSGISGFGTTGVETGLANGGPCSTMRKFSFPLFFPPNISASFILSFPFACAGMTEGTNSAIAIACHLRGYMLSRSV